MNRDETEVVSAIQSGLVNRIGRERFDLWFTDRVQLAWNGRLSVRVRDQFLLDRVRKQFSTEILAVLQGMQVDSVISYEVDPALKACAGRAPSASAEPCGKPAQEAVVRLHNASPPRPKLTRRKFERLETFVVGEGNRIAHTASTSAVARPGTVSPMFVYGPSGCGKTHLLEGIWSAVRHTSSSRVLFLSAEQFTSYFLEALRGGGLPSFRRKCREVELLVIDDVQFFSGKRATIIELQHTIDALLRAGRQLVLAADRPPAELADLGSELIARLSGGLICGIERPDYSTRLGVARRFAARSKIHASEEILELLASEMGGDARQICGALNRLEATSLALRQPITVPLARATLQDVFRATQRVVRLPDIERAVCDTFGLDPRSLRTQTRAKSISHPRMLAMWLARKYTQSAFTEISQYFGRKSHSTVISAEKKIARWVADGSSMQLGQEDCRVQDAIRRVEQRLRTG